MVFSVPSEVYFKLVSDVLFEEIILLKKLIISTLAVIGAAMPANAACGTASYYDTGSITASGAPFNPYGNTVAHPYLPFGTRLKIVNQRNGLIAYGVVRDRGPFVGGRTLDLSLGLFQRIESTDRGLARVCYYRM